MFFQAFARRELFAMSDMEPGEDPRGATLSVMRGERRPPAPLASGPEPTTPAGAPDLVSFGRAELSEILNLYGRKVAAGEWRDYAIDFTAQKAVFSVFRRTSECALYRIEKIPKLARKQGEYAVVTATGLILKRGHDLRRVIDVLDKKLKLVSG